MYIVKTQGTDTSLLLSFPGPETGHLGRDTARAEKREKGSKNEAVTKKEHLLTGTDKRIITKFEKKKTE